MTRPKLRIVHLEDSVADRDLLQAMLEDLYELEVIHADSEKNYRRALETPDIDLIISDFTLPSYNGLLGLSLAHSTRPEIPFIFFSGTIGEEAAVDTLTSGATDYVLKNKPQKLITAIERALREREERRLRAEAEDALRKREEWFRILTENSQDMVTVISPDGKILYCSPSTRHSLGYSPEELRTQDSFSFLHPEDVAKAREAVARAFTDPDERSYVEYRVRHANGSWRWLESIGKRLPEGFEVPGMVLNSRDITEKKETEAQFLRAQRMECLGVLSGGIAHDLNNILAPIMMGTELLKSYITDADALRMLETLKMSAERGSDIVKQILSFARGVSKSEPSTIDLRALALEVIKLVRGTFPKSIQIQTRFASDLRQVNANPTELHQLLMNLCVNARDAMEGGGLLQIVAGNVTLATHTTVREGTLEPGDYVRLSISDSGTGITPSVMEKLFEPFFTTKAEGKGTGLGLPTVLSIVKRHKGALDVQTTLGEGTTFHIYLPAVEAAVSAPEKRASTVKSGRQRTILLVDDETAVLEMTRLILEDSDYQVLVARDGIQALQVYSKNAAHIEMVITDISMPIMDGVTLCRKLRTINPSVRIICATGDASGGDDEKLSELTISRIVRKPYSADELLAALDQALA